MIAALRKLIRDAERTITRLQGIGRDINPPAAKTAASVGAPEVRQLQLQLNGEDT
jgi:hypothetical protein